MNYGELRQAVIDTVESDEATLVASIPRFVTVTEETILKTVRLNVFKRNAAGTVTTGNPYLAVPLDFLSVFSLHVTDGSGNAQFLEQKDVSFIREFIAPATTGVPRFYAQYDVDNFLLAPTPSDTFAAEINYFYRPASLTSGDDSTTTWLSINATNTLLYGVLVEAAVFQKFAQDVLVMYQTRFAQSLERLKNFGEGLETVDNYRYGQVRQPRT